MKRASLGLLTLMVLAVFAAALHAQGNFVYTNNNPLGPNTVSAFQRDDGGFLTLLPGSPFSTGGSGSGGGFFAAIASQQWVTSSTLPTTGATLSPPSIDPGMGALMAIAGSPFPTGALAGVGISLAGTPDCFTDPSCFVPRNPPPCPTDFSGDFGGIIPQILDCGGPDYQIFAFGVLAGETDYVDGIQQPQQPYRREFIVASDGSSAENWLFDSGARIRKIQSQGPSGTTAVVDERIQAKTTYTNAPLSPLVWLGPGSCNGGDSTFTFLGYGVHHYVFTEADVADATYTRTTDVWLAPGLNCFPLIRWETLSGGGHTWVTQRTATSVTTTPDLSLLTVPSNYTEMDPVAAETAANPNRTPCPSDAAVLQVYQSTH